MAIYKRKINSAESVEFFADSVVYKNICDSMDCFTAFAMTVGWFLQRRSREKRHCEAF